MQIVHATVRRGRAMTTAMANAKSIAKAAQVDAAFRTYLRSFRGVHRRYLKDYLATYEAHVMPSAVFRTRTAWGCARKLAATTRHYGDSVPQHKVLCVLKNLTSLSVTQGALRRRLTR